MTTPKVQTIRRQSARFYISPEKPEVKYPGVTSVLDMLPKHFLRYWGQKLVAEAAVDGLPTILQMVLSDQRDAAVDFLKNAPSRNTKEAADTGSEAHDLFERMARGETLGRVHPKLEPFVQHFGEFLEVAKPDLRFMEETVWSDTHEYAGSFDAFGVINGERVWLDWKTTRSGIHEEVGLQLSAYRHADHIIRADGGRVPLPQADGAAVLHVRPEGWKLVPVRADRELFEGVFLPLREVFRYEKELKASIVGKPVFEGPSDDTVERPKPVRRAPRAKGAAA